MSSQGITYARARLLLGISGVGSIVLISAAMLYSGWIERLLPTAESWHWQDPVSLVGFIVAYVCFMVPFDLLGGYVLPRRYERTTISFHSYWRTWIRCASLQAVVFLVAGLILLASGRTFGTLGVGAALVSIMLGCLYLQTRYAMADRAELDESERQKLQAATASLTNHGLRPIRICARTSGDVGFTGGVVGMPGREVLIVPARWIGELSLQELVAAIARLSIAVSTESRSRGIVVAVGWILSGVIVSAWSLGVQINSVASLVTVLMGATLFTFLGLLLLPMVSRQASYQIDQQLLDCGVESSVLVSMIEKLDQFQDNEPERSPIIESIFHPVPSVANRKARFASKHRLPVAWHAARMMIFLSWAGIGLLSRAVHCNVGRPDLWLMLPTD